MNEYEWPPRVEPVEVARAPNKAIADLIEEHPELREVLVDLLNNPFIGCRQGE